VTAGAIVGVASSLTDHVPYRPDDRTPFDVTTQLVTGLMNSVVVWFGVPLTLGYFLSRSWRQAAAAGGVFMAAAILSYFAYGAYGQADRKARDDSGIVTQALPEQLSMALMAGVIGGALGFFAHKRPSILLILILAIGAELVRRGAFSWQDDISTSENVLFIAGGVGIVAYVGVVSIRRRA
jgi:hypothetical protein